METKLYIDYMGLQIFLRTNLNISYFRRCLLKLIHTPGITELLLCSGYISERYINPYYRWRYPLYSILQDDLLNELLITNPKVITVGGMLNFPGWRNSYDNFVRDLRNNNINVDAYIAPKNNWHAKIAMALDKNGPIAGIIGSSNLTRPSYGETNRNFYGRPYYKFNHESDVLIWKDEPSYDLYFRKEVNFSFEDPLGPIDVILNREVKQSKEYERMNSIYNLIMNNSGLQRI